MEQASIDAVTKIVLPLLTFGIGILVTLLTKRIEKRNAEIKERVSVTTKLVNDWYNQVHQLAIDIRDAKDEIESQRAIYFYVRNRIVLPQLQLNLNFLREKKYALEFVGAVDAFLDLVTTSRAASVLYPRRSMKSGIDEEFEASACLSLFTKTPKLEIISDEEIQYLLDMLDVRLQRVTVMARHTLARKS